MLKIYLFGAMRFITNEEEIAHKPARIAQALLAYLLTRPLQHGSRDEIVDAFWPDRDLESGRNCLNTALWRLRSCLDQCNGVSHPLLLTNSSGDIRVNQSNEIWADVIEFDKVTTHFNTQPLHLLKENDLCAIENALDLQTDDLLTGLYTDWAVRERERLRTTYLDISARLMLTYQKFNNITAAIRCGHRILRFDPLREEVHRHMMQLYVQNGQRSIAIQQYETCRTVLKAELNIEPMFDTQQTYQSILKNSAASSSAVPFTNSINPQNLQTLIQHFEATTQTFEVALKSMQQTLKALKLQSASNGEPAERHT